MGKLIFNDIFLSGKHNLSHVWLLRPYALGKLILNDIFLIIKQNLSYAWLLRPHVLGKLILNDIYSFFLSVKAYPKLHSIPQITVFREFNVFGYLSKC